MDPSIEHLLGEIVNQIKEQILTSGASPEYAYLLIAALPAGWSQESPPEDSPFRWALLPSLCFQAAGGGNMQATNLCAAWFLYYLAAHIMDSIEDQDEAEPWWAELGSAAALNVATGLFFCASRSLFQLITQNAHVPAANYTVDLVHLRMMQMCSGQHSDLTTQSPSLQQYWEMVEGKSGRFFALACEAGACLASANMDLRTCFQQMGSHLGLLLQVLDDLEEYRDFHPDNNRLKWEKIRRSLPYIYTQDVLPEPLRIKLDEAILSAPLDKSAANQAIDLIEQSGSALYLKTELERHRCQALSYLQQIPLETPAKKYLGTWFKAL